MRDFPHLPLLAPEALLATDLLPPPAGPVRLTLASRPERERPTLLRECLGRIGFRYEIERLPDVPFQADLSLNMLPDLYLMSGKLHGSRNRRTRALVEGDTDDAVLLINIRGPHLIEQFGREQVLTDGEAILVSSADQSSFTHQPPGDIMGLRVPKSRLAPLLKDLAGSFMQRIPADNPALMLLRNYAALTWEERVTASPQVQQLMSSHVLDLLAVTVGATRDAAAHGNGVQAARLNAIKQDITRNLDQADLSVSQLADRHRCTPRSLQRLFEADGTTFTRYLLLQRLSRAHRMLADPVRHGEKISTVAFDCGFGDVSYFNRAFRQHYGAAPSDIRAQARQGN